MISDKLREVMASVEQLPLDAQDRIAEMVAEAIDDAIWQAQFDDPRSGPALDRLIEKAKKGPWREWPTEEDMQ